MGVPLWKYFGPLRRLHSLGVYSYSDTQGRVCKCISGDNSIRNSVASVAKLVVDVGRGCFRRHECLRSCSLARRRESRRYGNPSLSLSVCYSAMGRRYPKLGSLCGDPAAHRTDPKKHFVRQIHTKKRCFFCQSRRRCWYGLLLKTRVFEGVLAGPEKIFAAMPRCASPFLSLPVCFRSEGSR